MQSFIPTWEINNSLTLMTGINLCTVWCKMCFVMLCWTGCNIPEWAISLVNYQWDRPITGLDSHHERYKHSHLVLHTSCTNAAFLAALLRQEVHPRFSGTRETLNLWQTWDVCFCHLSWSSFHFEVWESAAENWANVDFRYKVSLGSF